jgi:methyltransferase (TIGR00027 family)
MSEVQSIGPESTAVGVALWRALHVLADAPPHVFEDEVGLQLIAPPPNWRDRPDMDLVATSGFRASIVARARFLEDLAEKVVGEGVAQYVILGAGLDTFAQRRPELAARFEVFEVDEPGPQEWKRQRLVEVGYGIPEWLHFVPVDFEKESSWLQHLVASGLDLTQPALVASTGVTMYLTREATFATLSELSKLGAGSTFAMTFLLPIHLLDAADQPGLEATLERANESGTPFTGLYPPDEMLEMALVAGFEVADHVSGRSLAERYFSARVDGLRPSTGEDFLLART